MSCRFGSSADRGTVEERVRRRLPKGNLTDRDVIDLGTGSYSITAIEMDADPGTYRLPKGLRLHLPGDYNSSIADVDKVREPDLADAGGLLKLPITAFSQDGSASPVQSDAFQPDALGNNDVLNIYVKPLSEPPSVGCSMRPIRLWVQYRQRCTEGSEF